MKSYKHREIFLSQEEGENSEWHEWRAKGIGASESSILMGTLPTAWNDILNLWKLKVGLREDDFEMNEAMAKGKALEPEAREKYKLATGQQVEPRCFELVEKPHIRASLDGLTKNKKTLVEIKCSSQTVWQKVKRGYVAPYYISQIQTQLLVSGAETAHYWVYREKEGGLLYQVHRSEEYINEFIRRADKFWAKVLAKEPALPSEFGIDMWQDTTPYLLDTVELKFIGHYKN